ALKAAQLGAKVAVVEKAHLGGTCLNHGCIPSKALLASAELLHRIRRASDLGVEVAAEASFDWPAIQKRKDKTLQTLRGGIKALFAGRGVTVFQGRAVMRGAAKVSIITEGKPDQDLTAEKIILAVGSVPSRIPGWPDEPATVCTSDQAIHWPDLPKRLLIVGGGYIGCEFACMMREFGVEVTIVEMLPHLLPNLDKDLGGALAKAFGERGITCLAGTKIEDLSLDEGRVAAVLSGGQRVEADRALVAVGRQPNTAELGLQDIGLTTDRGFISVNDRMETQADGVYCIGDANGRVLLAHAASAQGTVAAENALGGERTFDAPVPGCVYTFPEVATVGMTCRQASESGVPVDVGLFPMRYLGKAMAVGRTEGFVKVLRHREGGELLGVHMLGHNVTEIIAAAGALLNHKASVDELAELIFAHPTISEAFKAAGEDALGMALHLPPRKVTDHASS
ncbi:MAG: dihydrolipoyl dehydrogenase, partial [Planctomycetota bacterium]|nr:dihydrolipoyl dehydrogenase [Planctomycetota bacterium]